MYFKREDIINSKINDEELKEKLKKLENENYLELLTWFGGRAESGYNGYLIDFNNYKIYCFGSIGLFNGQLKTHAIIKEITNISEQQKNDILMIIKDERLLEHVKQDRLVMDAGSTINISFDGKKSIIHNAESKYTNGQINSFDLLKNYIESILNNINTVDNSEVSFTKIDNLNVDELKELRKQKIELCNSKSNKEKLNDLEVDNDGYLFFNCKMIIENIRLIDSKLINKFKNELSNDEKKFYKDELDYLDEYKSKYNDLGDVKKVLLKISTGNQIIFEEAKKLAKIKINESGRKIMKIQENEDYWFFKAGLPNERFFDDDGCSYYISKKDGNIIPAQLWLNEVQELNAKFRNNSKTIYDYYDEKNKFDIEKIDFPKMNVEIKDYYIDENGHETEKIKNIQVGAIKLPEDEIVSRVFKVAMEYENTNWKDFERGFSNVIDLGKSMFFGRNKAKSGDIVTDNVVGIIISKENLEINVCYGGSEDYNNLKNGTPLSIGDILDKTKKLITNNSNSSDEKLNSLVKKIDDKINKLNKEQAGMRLNQLVENMNRFDTVFICGTVIGEKENIELYLNEHETIQESEDGLPIEKNIDNNKFEQIKQLIINKMPSNKEYEELYNAYNKMKEMETGCINIFSIKINGIRIDMPYALDTSWGKDLLNQIQQKLV